MAQDKCAPKEAKSKSFDKYKAWLAEGTPPRKELGERIGGGWFVFKRNPKTGRIRPARYPFEYPSKSQAVGQAKILAKQYPDVEFIALQSVASQQVAS